MPEKKKLTDSELRAFRFIRSAIVHRGIVPTTREIAKEIGRSSSRTGALMLQALIDKGYLKRADGRSVLVTGHVPDDRTREDTVLIPIVGSVPCGQPLLASENIESVVRVSRRLARGTSRYFLLRARGDSMDLAGIDDGDLVLVRQQPSASEGDVVVALLDDEATVKQFHRSHSIVVLRPRSRNKNHKPIILTSDFQIQGIVVGTIPTREKKLL